MPHQALSRRDFMRTAAAAGAALGPLTVLGAEPKGSGKTFKIALIGCGGRGRGAVRYNLQAAKALGMTVHVVACSDFFKDRAEKAGKAWGVPPERCFGGPDGYRKLLATDAEIVLNATPPLFRPLHLEATIQAGKHAFIEKPVAVDPPGCRRVSAAGELARKKGLVIVSGTEMRHQRSFMDTHQALAVEKQYGPLLGGRVAFCIRHMFWKGPIQPKTPADLVRSWQNWIELSGDHIVEQHVHNIDVANWFCARPPISAVGFGGRARRPAGNMYDYFSVDFDYGEAVHIHSMCRQVTGCWNWVGHDFVYEKGRTSGNNGPKPKASRWPDGLPVVRGGHLQEQVNVLYHVALGKPLDQARAVAESTATAVLGRSAAYSGKKLFWRDMMDEEAKARMPELYDMTLKPTAEDFEAGNARIPKEGRIPVPGKPV